MRVAARVQDHITATTAFITSLSSKTTPGKKRFNEQLARCKHCLAVVWSTIRKKCSFFVCWFICQLPKGFNQVICLSVSTISGFSRCHFPSKKWVAPVDVTFKKCCWLFLIHKAVEFFFNHTLLKLQSEGRDSRHQAFTHSYPDCLKKKKNTVKTELELNRRPQTKQHHWLCVWHVLDLFLHKSKTKEKKKNKGLRERFPK